MTTLIGLDIGGANLKAATVNGFTKTMPFAIWKSPHQLTDALNDLLAGFPPSDLFAVTMTAELADCFATKSDGVDHILRSIETVAAGRPVIVWQTGGEFFSPALAREFPLLVAAANWHALATWCGRSSTHDFSLLIDIGTTTTDLIPIEKGLPMPNGRTDLERLTSGELVYTGVRRTPVCAVVSSVLFRGRNCPVAAEFFATMHDVYLLLGEIPENSADNDTANSGPATIAGASQRLARMLCCDVTEVTNAELIEVARQISVAQQRLIGNALESILKNRPQQCQQVIVSGCGEFLAQKLLAQHSQLADVERLLLSEMGSPKIAEAACAFAVARLAQEHI